MKILFCALLSLSSVTVISQQREGYGPEMEDSLHKELIGEWYLSGLYTTDVISSKDYSTNLKNSFQLMVTKDSVLFIEPESRFHKRNNRFFYTVTFEDHYLGTSLNLFNTKKHKIPFQQFHFQFVGNELLLEEELNSDFYHLLKVHRSYVFNRHFDPMQLESSLQHQWRTKEITNLNLEHCPDTVFLKKLEDNSLHDSQNQMDYSVVTFQRNPGWNMIAYLNVRQNSEDSGLYLQDKSTVLLRPENGEIELVTTNGNFIFKVLLIDESQLVLLKKKT